MYEDKDPRPFKCPECGEELLVFDAPRQRALGRPRIAPELESQIRAALKAPGRTDGVRKIAKRFGVDPGTVQRISRPFEGLSVAA